jgi:hypothetical protein
VARTWSDFFVTIGSAAAALTGLLFVAVALPPREIRLVAARPHPRRRLSRLF